MRLVRTFLYPQPIWMWDIISVNRVFDHTLIILNVSGSVIYKTVHLFYETILPFMVLAMKLNVMKCHFYLTDCFSCQFNTFL